MAAVYTQWTAVWGNAISIRMRRPENYGRDLTLRYPVTMLLDGTAIRITLDNFCGTVPVTVSYVTVARVTEGSSVDLGSIRRLTFNEHEQVTLQPGERIKSDPLPYRIVRGEKLAVSMYFADFTELRSAVSITGPLSGGYFATGDFADCAELPMELSNKTNVYYFLTDIEVEADQNTRAIICYGDSITAQAWPDYLVQRLLKQEKGHTTAVRKAASGTRILRQYDCITYDSYGLKGSTRFPHEIPVAGADTVIIQHGINDIIHPVGTDTNPFRPWSDLPTVDDLIDGIRKYIGYAKDCGLKVYLGTLLPIEGWRTYAGFREKLRSELNEWMRTTKEANGCIDFDAAVRDPRHPTVFAPGFDSGDHLHPSNAAYQHMAEIIPEELLK